MIHNIKMCVYQIDAIWIARSCSWTNRHRGWISLSLVCGWYLVFKCVSNWCYLNCQIVISLSLVCGWYLVFKLYIKLMIFQLPDRVPGRTDIGDGSCFPPTDLDDPPEQPGGAHHHPHHPLHGRGRRPRRPHCHHGQGQGRLLWDVHVPQETVR